MAGRPSLWGELLRAAHHEGSPSDLGASDRPALAPWRVMDTCADEARLAKVGIVRRWFADRRSLDEIKCDS